MDEQRLTARLLAHEGVADEPGLASLGAAAFAYASTLVEDDDLLTHLGNPTAEAKRRLRQRIEELLATTDDAPDDDDLDDFMELP